LSAINTRQRIMVIDDDQDMRQLLNNTLASEGFDTVVVADGDATLTLLNQIEPDLVILDSTARGVENFRELDRIRKHTDVPIIMLAANYEMESLRRAFSLGADDYIRKPFKRRAFLARIHAKLRRAREYNRSPAPVTT
jgi:DNA-binding response OmpR family regulator